MKRLALPMLALMTGLCGLAAAAAPAGQEEAKSPEEARKSRRALERNRWYAAEGVVLIAHRGASGYAPENTLPAFEKAVAMGAPACELDVHLSRDGQIMVMHDSTLERTTNGQGKVAESDSDDLRTLDAGEKFSPEFKGTRIPFLAEMIDALQGKAVLVCEIKAGIGRIEKKILDLIQEKGIEDTATIISFNTEALKNARALDREIITMYLKGSPSKTVEGKTVYLPTPLSVIDEAEALDVDALNLHYQGITPELVRAAHARGFKVYAWTVNSIAKAKELLDMGVDGITGDYPDRLQTALNAARETKRP